MPTQNKDRDADRAPLPPGGGGASLRNFIENASVPWFLVTLNAIIADANRAGGELLAIAATDLIGVDFTSLVDPDDLTTAHSQAEALIEGEISNFQAERRYVRADGAPVWVLTSVSIVRSQHGRQSYFSVQAININVQKRAEEALATSERRWSFALESAGQGVWKPA